MLSAFQKEVNTNFPENQDKHLESQNILQDNKMRIILMAIEIERLHKILNSKIDYYNQKMQDYIKRGQSYMQILELFYKGQIVQYLQENTELNQKILEKNALISKIFKENSQQEMNMLITQQCLQFEQELKSSQLRNLQLQKENQELRYQFDNAPQLRKQLTDLEQLYSQLLIEKNEEIQQLTQNNPQISLKNSQLATLNQLLEQKELELQEWQYSSQQSNLIHENQRLTKELKFLNDKLNLLLISNDHLTVKQDDIYTKNYYQPTQPNQHTQENDQKCQIPRRQQMNHNQYFKRSNTPQIQPSQIPINFQSLSQEQRETNNYQNGNQINELLQQVLLIQNEKFQSKQRINNQISILSRVLNLKLQEISQYLCQNKQNVQLIRNLSNYVVNQKLSTSPQIVINPKLKRFQKYYSVSPNNCYSQPYTILQPYQKSPVHQHHHGIRTETTFLSYQNIFKQQLIPIVMMPQNIVTHPQIRQQTQVHYNFSPIQKTVIKQSFQNPPYIVRGIYPNETAQFYQPIKINVNQPNLRVFERQEQTLLENSHQPQFDVYTTEFQVNSQENINNEGSKTANQQNFQDKYEGNGKSQKQKNELDRTLPKNISRFNETESVSQKSFEIQDQHIFNKIILQDPVAIVKQNLDSQQQSEQNIKENNSLHLIYKQFQDFRLIFKQKLQRQEQEIQKTYSNSLEQLQNLENQMLVMMNEKQQKIQNQRDNKFNRISQEYQSYKIQQPNSDCKKYDIQTQVNESNDLELQIASQKKLLNEQQTHFLQLLQLQDEIQNYYESLVSQLYQRESELNKEVIKIKQDHENQILNLTRLQNQSEEISHLEQQNSSLQQQLQDYMKEFKDVQFKLKFEQDQHQFTKHVVESLQIETNTYQNTIEEIQKRNKNLEQELKNTEQLLFETQNSKMQTQNQNKETQTISVEQQQSFYNDQIEIENLKQKLFFEQELSNQLNDSISGLQQQIQTQEQLLQQYKLSNSNQFEEIQNLTKEKIEIAQQLKMIQIKYLSLKEQNDLLQKQKDINQNNEQIQNMDVIQNLNFQIEDMKQLNQFLQNQLSQMQQNSEIQMSAQNTVLSSKIALLEKQLSTEKILKEQANSRILQLENQVQGFQNQLSHGQTNDLKEQIFQLSNQQLLLKQQKDSLVQSFELDLNQLKQQIIELTNQNRNYQEQIKDFETKQLLHLQLQKQYTNQTHLVNQQKQQIIILQQENNQNHNDLQKLRQNLKLDIEDFEGYQNEQINTLRKQIDNLNSQLQNQQRDINYLQSQIQFEQREKSIIIQNKNILDGHIKQMQEENLQLQSQIYKQKNDIEELRKNMRQSNIIDNSSNQQEIFIYKEQKTYKNQNESLQQDIKNLKQENRTLIQECQKLKDALLQVTEEKTRLEMIFNYQNQVQETQFQEIQQSQIITQNNKNEGQDQVKQDEFQIKQNQIQDLSSKISTALVKLDEFDDLNFRIEKIKQDLQNQIQKLKQQAIYIQQHRIQKNEDDKIKKSNQQKKYPSNQHNQQADEIAQIIQAISISIGDYIQLNSQIHLITEKLQQLLGDTNNIAASIQLQNRTLINQENDQRQKSSSIYTNYEEQYKELLIENDKLNQKANQYQNLLIQLQDEYYKQGSALNSITKEYQQINNKNEFKIIKLIHFEQLNDKTKEQEKQIQEYLQQIQDLQNYIDQEQKKYFEEITSLNHQIEENQLQGKNYIQINQENSTLKQEISNLQSEIQKQQHLIEELKLIQIQNQDEYAQQKQEAQRLYQRLLQISNSYNVLKEEKEQEQQRFSRESRQIQESSEKHKNENIQYKLYVDRLQKQLQEQKNQSDSNLQQQLKKVQTKLEASLQQQNLIHDEKKITKDQIQQQQEQLANQLITINQLRQEISRQEQVISQLSQQNNIQSSFVQEVTFFDDSKNSSPLEFKVKQLQNENSHLHQLLLDMEKDYTHKIKLQQLQIQGLNDKLREMVYEQTKKVPKVDEFAINYQNH